MLKNKAKTKIKTIHDSLEVLCQETERLVDTHREEKEINYHVEATISRRFDSVARHAALLLKHRKESGSKEEIPFFTQT